MWKRDWGGLRIYHSRSICTRCGQRLSEAANRAHVERDIRYRSSCEEQEWGFDSKTSACLLIAFQGEAFFSLFHSLCVYATMLPGHGREIRVRPGREWSKLIEKPKVMRDNRFERRLGRN